MPCHDSDVRRVPAPVLAACSAQGSSHASATLAGSRIAAAGSCCRLPEVARGRTSACRSEPRCNRCQAVSSLRQPNARCGVANLRPDPARIRGTRFISLIAPNRAVAWTKTMRASACARNVCLADENYRYHRLNEGLNRPSPPCCQSPLPDSLNQPSLATPSSRPSPTFKTHNEGSPAASGFLLTPLSKAPRHYADALRFTFHAGALPIRS